MVTKLILATMLSALLAPPSVANECNGKRVADAKGDGSSNAAYSPHLSRIEFTTPPQSVMVLRNETVQMDCVHNQIIIVSWYLDGDSLLPNRGGKFTHFPNGTLQINSVNKKDEGRYDCVVIKHFGRTATCSGVLTLAGGLTRTINTCIPTGTRRKSDACIGSSVSERL